MADDVVAIYRLKFRDLASKGLLRVQAVARGMSRGLQTAAKGIAILGTAAAAAGVRVATLFADRADEINKFSREVDISAESLQRLEFITNRQGASFDKVKSGIQKFTKSMGEFRAGTGSLKTVLDKVDPALGRQLLAINDNSDALDFAIGALSKYTDVQKQAAVAGALFGRSGGSSFARIVDGGADAFEKLNAEAAKFRPPISAAHLSIGEKFKDSLFNSQQVIGSIGDSIGLRLLPPLVKLLDRFNEFVVANRDVINMGLDRFFKRLGTLLEEVDFDALALRGKKFAKVAFRISKVAKILIENAGVLKVAMGALTGVFVVAKVARFLSVFGSLISVFGAPILVPIAAVIAAGVLIYKNWDKIRATAESMGIDVDAVFLFIKKAAALMTARVVRGVKKLVGAVRSVVRGFRRAKAAIPLIMDRIETSIKIRVARIKAMLAGLLLQLAKVSRFMPGGVGAASVGLNAANGAIGSSANIPQYGFGNKDRDVVVRVELDGEVRGANVQANVSTSSTRSRRGSNLPNGRSPF